MAPASVKLALKKLKSIYAARPRSLLEWYEFVRDDIILAPFFQWIWWWTGCCVACWEWAMPFAAAGSIEFCLTAVVCYIIFTLPCLRFCSVWTALYQERRNAKPPDEEAPPEKEPKQKKKKAMTEEEMLDATRKRQKNRPGEGDTKSFAPTAKKKKERGAKGAGNATTEDNIGGVISELKLKK